MRMVTRQYCDTEVALEDSLLGALLVVLLYHWKKEAGKGLVIIDASICRLGLMILVELLWVGSISFLLFALCALVLGISYIGVLVRKD